MANWGCFLRVWPRNSRTDWWAYFVSDAVGSNFGHGLQSEFVTLCSAADVEIKVCRTQADKLNRTKKKEFASLPYLF